MAFTLPSSIFTLYEEYADELLNNINVSEQCKLVYPERRVDCSNCVWNSVTNTSSNKYQSGGPIPFTTGICPYCNGKGFFLTPQEEAIRLRVYWNKKDWKKIANIQVPDGAAMVIGYITDLPKLERAMHIIIVSEASAYKNWKFGLSAETFPWGFSKDRYFVGYLARKT